MKWAEVSIRTSHEETDLIAEIFHDVGASGVVIEDPEEFNSYIESGLFDYSDLPKAEQTNVVTIKAYLPVDEDLDDRLRTRFEWGLLVDVQPPDFETRLAIVKNKAAQWGTVIDDDIAKYIAENVTSNVRQLEGTMNKILAYRDLIGREMDADAAHRAVEDFMKKNANLAPTAAMIITETSRYFGIDEEVIKGPSPSREAVNARPAAMYLVPRMTNLSTPDIGREFGKPDHTTVLHSLEQIEKNLKSDAVFKLTI